jgi:hypothetical protein
MSENHWLGHATINPVNTLARVIPSRPVPACVAHRQGKHDDVVQHIAEDQPKAMPGVSLSIQNLEVRLGSTLNLLG